MEAFQWAALWLYDVLAIWYLAGLTGGLLIFATERWRRNREPSHEDVRRAAQMYRLHYGLEAERVIGDHMLGSTFAADGRHC